MFQRIKRTLIAVLLAGVLAGPSAAFGRVFPVRESESVSAHGAGTNLTQTSGVPGPANAFDWADAGIGAAVAVVLVGAGSAMVNGRRRLGRHAVTH